MMKWIDINKKKPPLKSQFLAYIKTNFYTEEFIVIAKCFYKMDSNLYVLTENGECFEFDEVTHWMPLPDPPK